MRWYVSQNGKASGPFREERIAMLVKWGKVSRGSYICDTQLSAWIAIERSAFSRWLPQRAEPALAGARRARRLERLRPGLLARRAAPRLVAALLLAGLLATAIRVGL